MKSCLMEYLTLIISNIMLRKLILRANIRAAVLGADLYPLPGGLLETPTQP